MSLTECKAEADIAVLLDGSGSVSNADFRTMKNFVKKLVRPFVGKDTQVCSQDDVPTAPSTIAQIQRIH